MRTRAFILWRALIPPWLFFWVGSVGSEWTENVTALAVGRVHMLMGAIRALRWLLWMSRRRVCRTTSCLLAFSHGLPGRRMTALYDTPDAFLAVINQRQVKAYGVN